MLRRELLTIISHVVSDARSLALARVETVSEQTRIGKVKQGALIGKGGEEGGPGVVRTHGHAGHLQTRSRALPSVRAVIHARAGRLRHYK